jgi:excisionase family DNA binding protein
MGTRRVKRTIELTVERSRVVVAGPSRIQKIGICPECSAEVRLVTPEEAARLLGVSVREVYRRVEAGSLHFIETREGLLLICASSLDLSVLEI